MITLKNRPLDVLLTKTETEQEIRHSPSTLATSCLITMEHVGTAVHVFPTPPYKRQQTSPLEATPLAQGLA